MEKTLAVSLLLVIIGALLGGIIQTLTSCYASFREKKGIASALRAEIDAILLVIQNRGYLDHLRRTIAVLENPLTQPAATDVFAFNVVQNYFQVFSAVCPKIGLLGTASPAVIVTYTIAKSLLEDIATLRVIQEKALQGLVQLQRKPLLDITRSVLNDFNNAIQAANNARIALTQIESQKWLRILP